MGPRRQGVSQAVYDQGRAVLVVPVFTEPDAGVRLLLFGGTTNAGISRELRLFDRQGWRLWTP